MTWATERHNAEWRKVLEQPRLLPTQSSWSSGKRGVPFVDSLGAAISSCYIGAPARKRASPICSSALQLLYASELPRRTKYL